MRIAGADAAVCMFHRLINLNMATMLDHSFDSVDAYVEHFTRQDIPVLKRTVRDLAVAADAGETLNARQLAGVVMGDPLMTMKVLVHLQRHRRRSQNHDITTIDRVVMMMGINPFLEAFGEARTLEAHLADRPAALLGALHVVGRARRAAHFARDWAIARHDVDVDEITVAALLREATEILCWTFAPELSQQVQAQQAADPTLRSVVAQRNVFGFAFRDIQLGIARAWKLPELLLTLLDEKNAHNPRVRNVCLASDFARHLAHGWDDAALPDDITEIESLLHLNRDTLLRRLGTPAEHLHRFQPGAPTPPASPPPTTDE